MRYFKSLRSFLAAHLLAFSFIVAGLGAPELSLAAIKVAAATETVTTESDTSVEDLIGQYIAAAQRANALVEKETYGECKISDVSNVSEDRKLDACGPCSRKIIEIGPIDIVPSGPFEGPTPHITPGIPFSIPNFLECPLGRVIYHPAITIKYEVTCPNCGTTYIEEERLQFRGNSDGQLVPMCPGEKIRDRDPQFLEDGPSRKFIPPISDVPYPEGPYDPIPSDDGEFNCGTSLLCYLASLMGREEAERFMREAEEALRKAKGNCHHFAWEVVEDPWANCPKEAVMS
ncbi:MAG: hypothetical protein J0M12_11325 [Deltaproteobacteria bacterium]|nr:hypothetical protein [Deltaproteobacteria bacterium]